MIVYGLTLSALVYFAACYILYRIGSKFGPAPLGEYLIPFYNLILLARYIGVSPWLALSTPLPLFVQAVTFDPVLVLASAIFSIVAGGYFWGCVARALGKDFWMGALSLLLLGIPILILAFDSSATPVQRAAAAAAYGPYPGPSIPYERPVTTVASAVKLMCRSGEVSGHSFSVPPSGLIIGRHPRSAHVVLNSGEISSTHVRLTPNQEGRGVWVEDLHSTNGTYVSQAPNSWTRLQGKRLLFEGNAFYLGKRVVEFVVREA